MTYDILCVCVCVCVCEIVFADVWHFSAEYLRGEWVCTQTETQYCPKEKKEAEIEWERERERRGEREN